MLAIVNVTKDTSQEIHDYEIRINKKVIGKFKHKRSFKGAAQCLRDAADALDADPYFEERLLIEALYDTKIKNLLKTPI